MKKISRSLILLMLCLLFSACLISSSPEDKAQPRLTMFIGVDISGSFLRSKYFDDSLSFLANYIYCHLRGLGDLDIPKELYVGSIGGATPNEPKTFFPIQTFENKSPTDILRILHELFPKSRENPFTDFNAFFRQIATTVKNKRLILKPLSIVMISDGTPDMQGNKGGDKFRSIQTEPLELLSRNITLRLLYTSAVTGNNWQTKVPRKRVKIWTQDAIVMVKWKDPGTFNPNEAFEKQSKLLNWIKENIDFSVPAKRVD